MRATPRTSAPADSTADRPPFRPSALTGRDVAPDLARGLMLLLIVLANAPYYLWASGSSLAGVAHPTGGGVLDRIVQVVQITAVDQRTYPMFAFLFGYGIVQLYSRQEAAGVPHREARALLRRRNLWLLVFGAVHAALFWMGDVLGAYGLAGLVLCALLLDRSDRAIRIWAIVLTALLAVFGVLMAAAGAVVIALGVGGGGPEVDSDASIAESDPLLAALLRLGFWVFLTPAQGLLGLAVPVAMLLAWLAARHRVLEEPERHRPLLRRSAIIGIGPGWVVGALVAAQHLGALLPDAAWMLAGLSSLAGLACGIGYVAVFGLVAARMRVRGSSGGRIAWALQAVGKRSLSCYLLQSVVFAPFMSAWGLGLGADLGSASIALVAVLTWLGTVLFACVLETRGLRGPAEHLLRRLVYQPSPDAPAAVRP